MAKKKSNFVDAHAHISYDFYSKAKVLEIVNNSKKLNIEFIINNGGEAKGNLEVLELSKEYDIFKPAIGFHPENAYFDKNDINQLKDLLEKHKDQIVAIGEIGLDYYYQNAASKKDQLVFFEKQIQIALEYNLPAIIHLRDKDDQYNAYIDCYNIVKKYPKLNFMLHSFAGSLDIAKMFLNLNSYFSFSGVATFGSSKIAKEVIEFLPMDKLLVETDSPYLRPHPYKDLKNVPQNVVFTHYYIAGIKKLGMDAFVNKINSNLKKLFNLK